MTPKAGERLLQQEQVTSRLIKKLARMRKMETALRSVLLVIERSDHWWMNEPTRGGFDVDEIEAAIDSTE